ncbi:hypothetical protein GCM10027568_30690 [Humibacter soli]
MRRRSVILTSAIAFGVALSCVTAGAASAAPAHPFAAGNSQGNNNGQGGDHGNQGGNGHANGPATANADSYLISQGQSIKPKYSILDNDSGASATIVSHTNTAHGTLALNSDGTFSYTPQAGFVGSDSFTYTVNDAVSLFKTNLPPLATIGGVKITGGAYGSSVAPVPHSSDEVYGLTDRGPNVDVPDGSKMEPMPTFNPAIGKFKLVDGKAVLEKTIPLRAADGSGYNGLVNGQADTGETIEDINGNVLPKSPNGYDSEGLVALPDGTFWVSDEYGPFITHFDKNGRQIGRLSPFDGSLPAELAQRVPNKGMEGLTITPDGSTLVGIMQSALQTPDLTAKPAQVAPTRIVTYNLKTKATHEYLYLLTDPKIHAGAVSEITAISNTQFIVDERDGNFEPNAFKQLYKIDLTGATDVGPSSKVTSATYNAKKGGLLVGAAQSSIEAFVGTDDTATATTALASVGITPVKKATDVDLGALVTKLDPTGGFFGHDKVEGVATTDGGKTLVVSNDNDFGIDGVTGSTTPYQLHAKMLPNGTQDDGEYLKIDTTKLNDANSTATVTILVAPKGVKDLR